ncbi:LOW QUALITY PROTEIN: mucin-5AC [Drosophila eugracilis]|uniref:LOW QUALITY PROTEIN: mucin-5AC n=1 Tax=Drosophila eugracilis TaxID=29029 RepID=UPI001BDB5261|nr:LOW QUALITY PROTEIN: mucin-5AC [Drosophila eugracilis]
MHRTEKHSEASQLRLGLEFHQEDSGTDLQMSRKKCNNNQQRRGRRRRTDWENFIGIHGSISLTFVMLAICMAHTSTAVPAIESSSASSTVVTVAVTPSIAASSSSGGSAGFYGLAGSTTESSASPEQQQPQGQCLQDGLWVAETATRCEYQTSCRAIQRTGHCCPDYKCDCEKDGKTYANGDKLVAPDTPCTVCYCKGGEIVCSPVTCFRRDDCMPKYVPGRCCPEYDNCPILDNNPPLASEPVSSSTTSTQKPVALAQPAGFNWNITIKEITKPTEIRITDDNKAKPSFPTRKPSTSMPTTEGPAPSVTTGLIDSTTAGATGAAVTTASPSISSTPAAAATSPVPAATPTDTPATPTPSQDNNQKALPGSSESLKLIASVGYIERPHSPSSIVEQQVKPLITYHSDGLQPLAENDPSKVNIKREYTTKGLTQSTKNYEDSVPLFLQNGFKESSLVESSDGELEPDTAGSDNIYHIISTTEGPGNNAKVTTADPLRLREVSTTSQSIINRNTTKTAIEISTDSPVVSSEMPPSSSTHNIEVDDDVPQVESNPAYPSLPEDDFSLRDVNFPLVELEDVLEPEKDEPRSIPSPFEVNHKRVKGTAETNLDGSGSGSGGGDIDLYQDKSSTTEGMMAAASSIREKSAMVPLLMYSGEDISGETRIQNGSDLQLEKINQGEEMELGSGEVREPITPKTNSVSTLEIDELGSGAGQVGGVDPKADAESLKLDESQETVAKTSSLDKSSSSARAEKSFVERALPLGRLYLQRIY